MAYPTHDKYQLTKPDTNVQHIHYKHSIRTIVSSTQSFGDFFWASLYTSSAARCRANKNLPNKHHQSKFAEVNEKLRHFYVNLWKLLSKIYQKSRVFPIQQHGNTKNSNTGHIINNTKKIKSFLQQEEISVQLKEETVCNNINTCGI